MPPGTTATTNKPDSELRLLVVTRHFRLTFESPLGYYRIIRTDGRIKLQCIVQQIRGQAALLVLLTIPCVLYWVFAWQKSTFTAGLVTPRFLIYDLALVLFTLLLLYFWHSHTAAWARQDAPPGLNSLLDGTVRVGKFRGDYYFVIPQSRLDSVEHGPERDGRRLGRFLSWSVGWVGVLSPSNMIPWVLFLVLANQAFSVESLLESPRAFLSIEGVVLVVGSIFFLLLLSNLHLGVGGAMHCIRPILKQVTPVKLD